MEFSEVVRRRRMVRRYADAPVDPDVVRRALDHATRAPSAGFTQGVDLLLLDTPADVRRFWEATGPDGRADAADRGESRWLAGMRTAPVVVVPLTSRDAYLDRYAEPDKGWSDRDEARWPVPYWYVDAGMAALLVLQTATDAGLGACFFGIPPDRLATFREEFGVPGHVEPIGAITLGHPASGGAPGSPARRARRPVDEVVHRGRW